MAIFIDGSWQSEKGFYNSSTGKFVSYDEENTYTDEEIVKIKNNYSASDKEKDQEYLNNMLKRASIIAESSNNFRTVYESGKETRL